jgi:amino-acid N-acetyltransferase
VDLYRHLREFYVLADIGGTVCGCCALAIVWEDIAEIRSLTVREDMRGQGLGRRLVHACMAEAADLGIPRVFTLTYKTEFFSKLGYRVVEKDVLPNKIWADCIHCAKFPDCDEIAMLAYL